MSSTPATADLCDRHGDAVHACEPVFHAYGGRRAFSGPASTVRCFEDNSKVKEAVEGPGEGRVLVVDGGGARRRALLGGPQTLMIGRVLWDEFFSNNDWPMASTVAVVMVLLILVPLAIFNRYQARAQESRG